MASFIREMQAFDRNCYFEIFDDNAPAKLMVYLHMNGENTVKDVRNDGFNLVGAGAFAICDPQTDNYQIKTINKNLFLTNAQRAKFATVGDLK